MAQMQQRDARATDEVDECRLPDAAFPGDDDVLKRNRNFSVLFYATRTTSQIAQVCDTSVPTLTHLHACSHSRYAGA
jgi:hypothetical protein